MATTHFETSVGPLCIQVFTLVVRSAPKTLYTEGSYMLVKDMDLISNCSKRNPTSILNVALLSTILTVTHIVLD